jgi:methylated-DNA-[protein]-cysteine S-methyltransferase
MSATARMSIVEFKSPFGWCAIAGRAGSVSQVWFGYDTPFHLRDAIAQSGIDFDDSPPVDRDLRAAADLLADYLRGEPVDLTVIPIEAAERTPFQARVVRELRHVGYGKTVTYAELAERAGRPGAARAVGTVMSTNRLPLLIPCHRVRASGGRLGGYSAPQGLAAKRALLAMESGAADWSAELLEEPRLSLM